MDAKEVAAAGAAAGCSAARFEQADDIVDGLFFGCYGGRSRFCVGWSSTTEDLTGQILVRPGSGAAVPFDGAVAVVISSPMAATRVVW